MSCCQNKNACKLNTYVANLMVWTVKLHNIHWNVVGPIFKPVHEYTEALYDQCFEAYDEVAEIQKMRGATPLSTMKDYLEAATIEEVSPRAFSCCEALQMVYDDMKKMQDLAKEIRAEAAERDDFQVQATFEGYISAFQKELWFLDAMKEGHAEESCGCKK